ncbi:putative Co-chaperone [Papiliotrema laurentii]|uniref:Tetratricopeptide repeat and J domain-containing co-chaperone DNJ1 n=1 Tax=Papiliotrema laurentii TaxID=5418 RepID=A0AAD9FUS0_PAPLA|nr:putative Co-chaperone [Papiliotrema laurentii]
MKLSAALGLALPLVLSLSALTPVLGERTAQQIVSDANKLLSEGSYVQAARAYGEAIELDPSSYVNYYKRATVYLSLGKHSAALDDFDAILRLNPGFAQAHWQKAKILAKEGRFDEAQAELKQYSKSKVDSEAEDLGRSITQASAASKSAHKSAKGKHWQACVDHATKALEVGPNSVEMRQLRVECSTQLGDVEAAYGDLTRLASLDPSNIALPMQLSHISYFILGSATAMSHIKQCLHYDPDSKPCKKVHKLLRSLEKDTAKARNFVEGGSFRQAIKLLDGSDGLLAKFEQALDEASTAHDGIVYLPPQFSPKLKSQSRLELYALACKAAVGANDLKRDKGARWCEETLSMDEGNVDGLVGRGERLMKEEKWEEALRTLEVAFEKTGRSSQDIANRLNRAQKLLKVSKQKDYYKVLGVPRDADERQIKKAFRTKAKKAHPDVGGTEEQMAALNEAYEVLSNQELRQRYDNGDDPNDPTGGQGGNPFAHHSGGGMPFQFFQQGGFQGFPGGGGRKMQFQWGM